jgi:predicted permease
MRACRLLLRLYPRSFRDEYGEEMCAIIRRQRGDVSGPLGVSWFWLGALAGTFANAIAVHLGILRQDLVYASRSLGRARGFAVTAILIVGLGIGANTAVFSVTDFVLVRPLPFPEADRLVKLWEQVPGYAGMELSPPNYRDWKRLSTSFDRMGAFTTLSVNLVGRGEPERVEGVLASADLLPALGVQPALGRSFTAADDRPGAPATLILTHRFWQTAFAGDPSVLGTTVRIDDRPFQVIGVMPPDFSFPSREAACLMPLNPFDPDDDDRNNNYLEVVARLKPGVTLEAARAEMDVVATQLRQQYPKENEDTGAVVLRLRDEISRQSRMLLLALGGAAVCVLLIVCANLSSLLLARALDRRRELAVRAALGAGRERLVRQLATESVVLAALGGALGVLVAVAAVPLLTRLVPATLPTAGTASVDIRVLGFALLLTALTGVGFSLIPVLRAGGDASANALREDPRAGGGRRERLRSALGVAEVTLSIVLLVGAGLLLRALWRVRAVDPGFRTQDVQTLTTALPMPRYAPTAGRIAFYSRVLDEVRRLPGVTRAAYVTSLPMVWRGGIWPVGIEGAALQRTDRQTASLRYATPDFFATMGIPIRAGRDISTTDTLDAPWAAVVSESFVHRYWPGQNGLGRTFQFAFHERTIVGVVGDVRVRGLEHESEPQVYLPATQQPGDSLVFYAPKDLVIRSSLPLATLAPAVRAIVQRVDPEQPISDVRTMADIVEGDTASRAAQARVVAAFAAIAILLATIGIHGLLSFLVSQRTPEIGVRIALGAGHADILALVLGRSAWLAMAGLVPGVVLAYAVGRALQSLLAGVAPDDPVAFTVAVSLTAVTTLAGSLLPARRALSVDPVLAMRAE